MCAHSSIRERVVIMLKLIMHTLKMMDRRNEMRFEILYAYLRMNDRVRSARAMENAQEMSAMVRGKTHIDWEV